MGFTLGDFLEDSEEGDGREEEARGISCQRGRREGAGR